MTPEELAAHIEGLGERPRADRRGAGGLSEYELARLGRLAGAFGSGRRLTRPDMADLESLTRRWMAGGARSAATDPTGRIQGARPTASWIDDVPLDDGARWIDEQVRYAASQSTRPAPSWLTVDEVKARLGDDQSEAAQARRRERLNDAIRDADPTAYWPADERPDPEWFPYTVRMRARDNSQDAFARAAEAARKLSEATEAARAKLAGEPFRVKATAWAVPIPDPGGLDGVHWRVECSAGCPTPVWLFPAKERATDAYRSHIELVHK